MSAAFYQGELNMLTRIGAHFFFLLGATLVILVVIRIIVRTYYDETLDYSTRYKVLIGIFLAGLFLTAGFFAVKSLFG